MNNNGQFLLYDMLLAFIIILILLVSTTYLVETSDVEKIKSDDYQQPRYLLDLLEDEGLLRELSSSSDRNDDIKSNDTIEKIDYILSTSCRHDYALSDETINKTLINHSSSNYRNVYSSSKMVNKHEYNLKLYR